MPLRRIFRLSRSSKRVAAVAIPVALVGAGLYFVFKALGSNDARRESE